MKQRWLGLLLPVTTLAREYEQDTAVGVVNLKPSTLSPVRMMCLLL